MRALWGDYSTSTLEDAAAQIPAALVLDSRGVYDALAQSESACLGLKDKRSGLEALSMKRSLVGTQCGLRWTHSAVQLADCMTKDSEEAQKPLELLKRRGWKWRLVFNPSFTSARKRAQKGHDVLDYLPSTAAQETLWNISRDSTTEGVKASMFLKCACTVWTCCPLVLF